ncbi:phage tail assembly chaperone [Alkalicoccobacillus plakortidis]|uniref:Phage portal protein n=1 Tax=Alkalicoccobacillus plakortidis TaxID=444060 RepID=A0ABT0XDW5_9BACI|nr:phage portal protein [Alkalicoccobacillus plakortidis]MCM2674096.1 phage portal protein [Alkalicoccobacillus plakortidis]
MSENKTNQEEVKEESHEEQIQDLSIFLPGKVEEAEEVKVLISKRFTKDGKIVPFIFKPISTDRVDELEKDNTTYKNVRGTGRVRNFDNQRFMQRIAVESTVFPDFTSEKLRKAYKTEDPVEVARKILSVAGEFSKWLEETQRVNGFLEEDDLEELAKN